MKRSALARRKTYLTRLKARYKEVRQRYTDLGHPSRYLWIMGCQRSGTTHLEKIFRSDLDSAVFGEFSELSIHSGVSVWKPFAEVESILANCNARYAVARPLFESDRAGEILDYFPNSHAVWLFRDCPHVVDSMIRKWNDGFFEVSRKNEANANGIWRLEGLGREIDRELGSGATIQDKYALYWLKRNETVFATDLEFHDRFICLAYEQLTAAPEYCVDRIMALSGLQQVWRGFKTDTHARSVGKPVQYQISPSLLAQCEVAYARLMDLAKLHFPRALS